MKRWKQIMVVGITIGTIILGGCTTGQPSLQYRKQMVFKNNKNGKYYRIPFGSVVSDPLNSKDAKSLRKATKGILSCSPGSVIVTENAGIGLKWDRLIREYNKKLTKEEIEKERRNPGFISRPNSKEYKDYLRFIRESVQKGKIICMRPMSSQEVLEYKRFVAQQQKIANDPRVVAAKINANAQLRAARMQQQAINNMALQQSINANTPKFHNVFIY